MSVRIVGAGLGRTGTMSLKGALEQIGFGPAYHMIEVIERPGHSKAWYRISHGGPFEWDVFDGYQSILDWPAASYWREIADHYPDAKVILSVRDPEAWYKSVKETIYPRLTSQLPPDADDDWRHQRAMAIKVVLEDMFGGRFLDKDHALAVFKRHNQSVIDAIEPSRLLVFEAKEGWEPLCRFLGVPVPDEPFPRLNDTAAFHQWSADMDQAATPQPEAGAS